jgi:glyoxylase I family protein
VLGFHRVGQYTSPGGDRQKVFLRHERLRVRLGLTQHQHSPREAFDETRVGLEHLAFAISSRAELDGAAVLVFRDPDYIQLELFFDPSTTKE